MNTILVIDGDSAVRSVVATIIGAARCQVAGCATLGDAQRMAGQRHFDLVLAAARLPDGDAAAATRWFREFSPGTVVVCMAAAVHIATAVDALRAGAADYLLKPLVHPEELRLRVRRALEHRRDAREAAAAAEERQERYSCDRIIARDPRSVALLGLVRRTALAENPALLIGPPGAGKATLARCLHVHSGRRDRVFLTLECAGLSPQELEHELFGREKSASNAAHGGCLEAAAGGTLYLDEVAALGESLTVRLGQVIEGRVSTRAGGARQYPADVRLLAATVAGDGSPAAAAFLSEIKPVVFHVVPLHERPGDIEPLARAFLAAAAARLGQPAPALCTDALSALCAYPWPGNVRELENTMQVLAALGRAHVQAADLPLLTLPRTRALSWKEIEWQAIEDALRDSAGNRRRAARQLGMGLRTLQYRLKERRAESS